MDGGLLLVGHDGETEFVDEIRVRIQLDLSGAGQILELSQWGARGTVLDEEGRRYVIDGSFAGATLAPSFADLCDDGVGTVALSTEDAVVTCRGSERVWVAF